MRLCKFFFVGCLSLVSLASHAETLNGLYQVLEADHQGLYGALGRLIAFLR